jgi:hypothetical protein
VRRSPNSPRTWASGSEPSGRISGRVLYIIGCGSPAARHLGILVGLAQTEGWDVCVVVTPDGRKFVDAPSLSAQSGYPVRSQYKNPGDPDVLPNPNAMIALGLLVEGQGRGLPIVAVPYTNAAMAAHPAFLESVGRLRGWGVTVLFGPDVLPLHAPGTMESHIDSFPWQRALDALRERDNAGLQLR